jgi:hypothetical protein
MSEYLGWYLVELRSRLEREMPMDRVATVLAEVESHLRESALRNADTPGVSEDQALIAAMHSFGSPEKVALAHLGEGGKTMFGIPRMWVVLGSAFIAIACWDFHWMSLGGFFDNFGATWQNGLAAMIGGLALVIFFLACRKGYRSYRLPVIGLTAAMAVGMIFFVSFAIVGEKEWRQGFSRFHLARDVATAHRSLEKLDTVAAYIRRGMREISSVSTLTKLPPEYRDLEASQRALGLDGNSIPVYSDVLSQDPTANAYPLLSGYVAVMVDGRIFGISHTANAVQVRESWQKAPQTLKSIEHEKENLMALLQSAESARSGQLFFFNSSAFRDPVFWTIVFLPGLLLLDTIAYFAARRRRTWPRMGIA